MTAVFFVLAAALGGGARYLLDSSVKNRLSPTGPAGVLAVLAVLEPEALRKALAEGNVTALTRVPGIGKRGAERMVDDRCECGKARDERVLGRQHLIVRVSASVSLLSVSAYTYDLLFLYSMFMPAFHLIAP